METQFFGNAMKLLCVHAKYTILPRLRHVESWRRALESWGAQPPSNSDDVTTICGAYVRM